MLAGKSKSNRLDSVEATESQTGNVTLYCEPVTGNGPVIAESSNSVDNGFLKGAKDGVSTGGTAIPDNSGSDVNSAFWASGSQKITGNMN